MRNNVEILIVEDSQTQAVQLQNLLEKYGFRVSRAGNGREAVTAIEARRPTLVISDIVMPEMDGYQLSRYIKENPALKDLPVILLTTLGNAEEVMEALESKADNFITKPYNEEFLLSRIKYTLSNQKLRKKATDDGSIELLYGGKKRRFTSEPAQMVNLLLSTFDNAIQKNRELERANREQLKSQLALKRLNEQLEDMVETRTQALAVSDESHRALLDNNADAIIVIDKGGKIRFVNPAAETLLGRSAEELLYTSLDFPLIVGQSTETEIARVTGEPVVTEVRAVETLWEGEAACLASLRDITARKQAEAALQQAKEVAEAADQAKSEFLANMSHEIRTPMNGIIGMTGLLFDTALTPEQREYAETVETCAKSLLGIVEDVLNFSTMEAGTFDLDLLDFNLQTTLADVRDQFASMAQEKDLELTFDLSPTAPTVLRGDPGCVRQVLGNLIGNACKFTEQGEITVRVGLESETDTHATLRFAISDTGIGIPADRLNRLFQAFSQVDGSSTRKYGGAGLGLALSKRLVELMGGRIGVESQPGQGSTFWFTASFDKQDQDVLEKLAHARRDDLAGLSALIVDGNNTNRTILRHQLSGWDIKAHTAKDAAQALEMLTTAVQENRPYDLAVLDWSMPDMDGLTLAQTIRTNPALAGIRLVMLTSVGQRGSGKRVRQAGIQAYLTKPVLEFQLYECLRTVMGQPAPSGSTTDSVLITRHTLSEIQQQASSRILVAEDNQVNQKLIVRLVEKLGFQTDIATNGQEALEALNKTLYAAVLMDCQMPELDGFQATAQIREHEKETGAHMPIIALTGLDMEGDRERCLAAGMDDYISKPLNPDKLKAVLTRLLRPAKSVSDIEPQAAPAAVRPAAPAVVDQPRKTAPVRLLVAEDNLVNQKLIVRLVEKLGYKADVAGNGREAVEAVDRASYAAVLMDCQMPEMDGFEATAQIRERDRQAGSHMPIIAVTAHAVTGDRERCLAAGMDDYISKPVNPDLLKAALLRWIPPQEPLAEEQGAQDQPSQQSSPSVSDETEPNSPPFDVTEALNRVDGDKEFLIEMAELFLTEYPRFLSQLQTAVKNKEGDTIVYAAHTLKGSVGNFVAADAFEAALNLEEVGRQGDLSRAPAALEQLESALNRLTPALANLKLEEAA